MKSKSRQSAPPSPPAEKIGRLCLEALENRLLLSAVFEGVDPDGDTYEIKLTGPGSVTDASLDNLTVAGTSMASKLSVRLTDQAGDGQVNVGLVDTGSAALGQLEVPGDLGGLLVGRISQLTAGSLGFEAGNTNLFEILGEAGRIRIPGGIRDATVTIAGNLGQLQVGTKDDTATHISNSSFNILGDVQKIQLQQSFTAGSFFNAEGDVQLLDIDQSVMNGVFQVGGDLVSCKVDGGIRSDSLIEVQGSLTKWTVKKTVSDTEITIGQRLGSGLIGGDLRAVILTASAIDRLRVGDDLDDTRISVTDDLVQLQADDSQNLILRVSGALGDLRIKKDMDNALISALNGIGTIQIRQDLNRSTIVGGIDIGPDLLLDVAAGGDDAEWGNVVIDRILVRGDMLDTSIACGVSPVGAYYGDGNDAPTANDVGTARIHQVVVNGQISSTNLPGETFAISAADGIDLIRSGRRTFTGAAGMAVQQF